MNYSAKFKHNSSPLEKVLTILGLVLCGLFLFILICNLTIIIKGARDAATPPSVLGVTPLVVLSGSMSGDAQDHIESGDLIFVTRADTDALNIGDIISFRMDGVVVTHRIIDVNVDEAGIRQFTTKGDANNAADEKPVSADQVLGVYQSRIPRLGDLALFMQKPLGLLLFCGLPVLAYVIYDMVCRQRYAMQRERERTARLQERLERLGSTELK